MPVISYNKKKNGNQYAFRDASHRCKHFKVSEFASPDGASTIKISTELITRLESIREYFGGKVLITSGYRSPAYNASIGGYKYSRHAQGLAADIVVYNAKGKVIPPKEVMVYLWRTGWKEGGIMSNATHVGYRTDYKYFMEERGASTSNGYPQIKNVPEYFGMLYKVKSGKGRVRNTYKIGWKLVDTKKIGSKVYFEKVFKSGVNTWGKIKNGQFMLMKTAAKNYFTKL